MLPSILANYSRVIALIGKMKNTTVRKCLDCLSQDVMMKSVHMYKKLTKQIFIYYCNAAKCSAELTA